MNCAVYLIQSLKDNGFYIGISQNPQQRLNEHNAGKLRITAGRRPFELVWCKFYNTIAEARRHEKWLKKKSKKYKERLAEVAQW
ncbi:MAG: Excinuclease ABC C subunit domain protein [Parcubacteria group bacterium GW2011_GWC2_42_13]|nr:MAG: Excinuclease ABC C subunit domain protein [Parcubacteria group bacterium GW2011_GWC2_42_13]